MRLVSLFLATAFLLSVSAVAVGGPGCGSAKSGDAKTAAKSGCSKTCSEAEKAKCASASAAGRLAKARTASCCPGGKAGSAARCAPLVAGRKTRLEGSVVCAKCDLELLPYCRTLLRTQEGCTYRVAGELVEQLREQEGHASKTVRVHGRVGNDRVLQVARVDSLNAPATEVAGL